MPPKWHGLYTERQQILISTPTDGSASDGQNATLTNDCHDEQRVCMHLGSQDLFRLHDLNANGVLEEEALRQTSPVFEGWVGLGRPVAILRQGDFGSFAKGHDLFPEGLLRSQ